MAADFRTQLILEQSRKRQRLNHAPKLLPNEQVEVRSMKEGFRGSWHRGTVIECKTQIRVVKFDHISCENGPKNLVEFIPVLFAVDGIIPTNWEPSKFPNFRGKIRPIPPRVFKNKINLHYGKCVDVFHENAWWEGVIFDNNNNNNKSDERLVFFPDLGDELRVPVMNMRVTQDWDAASDEWKIRADWIFLEIFEELKMEIWPVFVSVKQIWCDVKMTKCYVNEMKEWTCPVKESWKETVKSVMLDNFKLKMTDFFHGFKFSDDFGIKKCFLDSTPETISGNKSDYENLDSGLTKNVDFLAVKPSYEDSFDSSDVSRFLESSISSSPTKEESLRTKNVKRSSKRARKETSPLYRTPRTVLSWVIDNNIVLPRAKVQYYCKKNGNIIKEGRVTRDGIKCNCCKCIFSLVKFQKHCGTTNGRPSANIFLEDGRSLLDCQLQLKLDKNSRFKDNRNNMENDKDNDYICSVCQYGGELVLCDQCPSSFHTSCVGLKEVPDGEWFCPSCCCKICNKNGFNENNCEENMDSNTLNCEQCERQYHIGCLKQRDDLPKVDTCLEANRFCSLRCDEIYVGLEKILGKPIPVGRENLTWTLRKYTTSEYSNYDNSNKEELIENYSKLNVAISVMHECFEPVKEAHTGRDIVEDVIFCRQSELRRLNFKGFYTVLLEKDDELISTGVVRIYGEKVAEVPLVGTRFQYRRRGMCHILMHQLEKELTKLGVERLVLPAVSSVLQTWTKSFGFSVMTESEKMKLLGFTFLDFQGTTMCHKFLATEPNISTGNSCSSIIDLDRTSDVLEESQEEKFEESETAEQSSLKMNKNNVNTCFLKCYTRRKVTPVRVKISFQ